jgi:DNA repair exonuclease SbcCD ATPase subunit
MLNEGEDGFIRHGAKRCEVTLTFRELGYNHDGAIGSYPSSEYETDVTWWKDVGKGGCYRLGDQEYTKTGRDVPDSVAQVFGIGRMEVDATTTLTPQLSEQGEYGFLVDETGSRRARILGKATRLDRVVNAQLANKKALDNHKREAARFGEELSALRDQLAGLPDVEGLTKRLNNVVVRVNLVRENLVLAGRARELGEEMEVARSRVQAVDTAKAKEHVTACQMLLSEAEGTKQLLTKARELVKARAVVAAINLDSVSDRLRAARAALGQAEQSSDALRAHNLLSGQIQGHTRELTEVCTRQNGLKAGAERLRGEYAAACQEAGVCEVCGGLLSHEECGHETN